NRKCMRQGTRRDDLAGCKRRIRLIARKKADEMAQGGNRSTQHVRSDPMVDGCAVALEIDCEGRKCPAPILGIRCDRMTRPDKQVTVRAKCCDRVGGRKLPSGKDRLHDFETMRSPVDARQQCSLIHTGSWRDGELEDDLRLYSWLGEALEGEH